MSSPYLNRNPSTLILSKKYVFSQLVLYRILTTEQNEDNLDDMQLNLYHNLKKKLTKPDILTGILTDKANVAIGMLLAQGGNTIT